MMVSKEQFITTTEFANRYNKSRPIDKDFMPLEPSFVKLLCEQGKLEHSTLPARDGRKKDIYMIPEHELETVEVILNGDKAVKEEPARMMSTEEVAAFLGAHISYVNVLIRKGKLKAQKIGIPGSNRWKYELKEDDVLQYAEEHPVRQYKKQEKAKSDIPDEKPKTEAPVKVVATPKEDPRDEDIKRLKSYISRLESENSKLKTDLDAAVSTANTLRGTNNKLEFENADLRDRLNHASKIAAGDDKDIFDAYRRGFKDGFEMGGAH